MSSTSTYYAGTATVAAAHTGPPPPRSPIFPPLASPPPTSSKASGHTIARQTPYTPQSPSLGPRPSQPQLRPSIPPRSPEFPPLDSPPPRLSSPSRQFVASQALPPHWTGNGESYELSLLSLPGPALPPGLPHPQVSHPQHQHHARATPSQLLSPRAPRPTLEPAPPPSALASGVLAPLPPRPASLPVQRNPLDVRAVRGLVEEARDEALRAQEPGKERVASAKRVWNRAFGQAR